MSETAKEMESRVAAMANSADGGTWDLSPNDCAALAHVMEQLEIVRKAKDTAYSERNQCVAVLARMAKTLGWRVGLGLHPASDTAWETDWRTILYIDTPEGQVSWHFHDSEAALLRDLPAYRGEYDGHTTPEKYNRLRDVLR